MKNITSLIALVFVIITIVLCLFGVPIPLLIALGSIPLLSFVVSKMFRKNNQCVYEFNWIDLSLFVLFVYEIMNPFLVKNTEVSLFSGFFVVSAIIIYFIITTFFSLFCLKFLCHVVTVVGFVVSMILIVSFLFYVDKVKMAGFYMDDIIALRFMYSPMNMQINDWGTMILLLSPFSLLSVYYMNSKYKIYPLIVFFVCTYALLTTFSRGTYIAFAVFIVLLGVFSRKFIRLNRIPKRYLVVFVSLFVIAVIPIRKPVFEVVQIHSQQTQVRSSEGRYQLWENCFSISRLSPLWGHGAGSFPEFNKAISYKTGDTYSRRTTNSYLQILVEKGWVGISLYLCLLAAIVVNIIKNKHSCVKFLSIVACVTLIAVGVREVTFSTLFDEQSAFLLLILWICLIRLSPKNASANQLSNGKIDLFYLAVCSLLFIVIYSCKYRSVNNSIVENQQSVTDSYGIIKSDTSYKNLSPVYFYNEAMKLSSSLDIVDFNQFVTMNDVHTSSNSNMSEMIKCMEAAQKLSPSEPVFVTTLGWMYINNGELDQGIGLFEQYLSSHKNIGVILISLGLCYEKKRQIHQAEQCYLDAVVLSPYLVDSYFFKDLVARNSVLADTIVGRAISILEPHAETEFNLFKLTKLYLFRKKIDSKERLIHRVRLLPNLNRAWITLGDIYMAEQNLDEAFGCYKKAAFLDETDYLAYDKLYYLSIIKNDVNKIMKRQASQKYRNLSRYYTRHFHNIYKLDAVSIDTYPVNIVSYTSPIVVCIDE